MGFKRFIILFFSVWYACGSYAQIKGEYVQSRILILLDESSSMIQPWASGKQKYRAAHDIIVRIMDSVYAVNDQVQFGLRVFGHQHTVPENDCYDTRNEVAFSTDNRNQMALRLDDIHPLGVTPIAFALTEAAEKDLVDEGHNAYSIILITDGGESCGGDICAVMKKLVNSKVFFKPYIVSLENDPALKSTYSCMGSFLQVTDEKDIPHAVQTIVEAFRPALKLTKVEYKEAQTTNIPSALKTVTPVKVWKVPPWDIFPELPAANLKQLAAAPPVRRRQAGRDEQVHLPPPVIEQPPALPKPEHPQAMTAVARSQVTVAPPEFRKMKAVKTTVKLPRPVIDTPVLPKPETYSRLKPAGLRQFNVIFVIEEHTYATRPAPKVPPLRADLVQAPPKPPEKKEEKTVEKKEEKKEVRVEEKKEEKKPEIKVERVDNSETTVEVYLTNGAGKYYTTSPQVLLLDPKTGSEVKKFYRYVDPDGNPDPQTGIPPGVYDLTFASNRMYVLKGVMVLPNKKNKFIVTVKTSTLSFAYKGPPNTPIKENWTATVTERNKAQGRVQDQRMNERLQYEPGNYHIEINTFPRMYRNEDLDFAFESVISIEHPGFARFVPTDPKTTAVVLYQRMGDKFLSFYTLELNDPRAQHLQIQPGDYQAHFQKGPGPAGAAEKVVVFRIKPNEETVVELR